MIGNGSHAKLRKPIAWNHQIRCEFEQGREDEGVCAVLLLAAGMAGYLHRQNVQKTAEIEASAKQQAQTENRFVGTWRTQVRYAWGDTYEESFELKRFAGELTGTASFLKYPRGIQDLHVDGSVLRFVTHSAETVNDKERELTHSYVAELDDQNLRMHMHTTGGFTTNPPQEFMATRIVAN